MAGKLLLLLLPLALARFPRKAMRVSQSAKIVDQSSNYTEMWFQEDLDHINRDPGYINIRVLKLNSPYSLPTGPLIIYTGGEAPIDVFFSMSGWIKTVLATQFNCTIYFIEHRYYGQSLPSPFSWNYLSSEQVLYDYADIIQQLRPSNDTPVITIGGSYAGMLSAWMRLKYTHIVDGAIATSATVFMGLDDGNGYFANVTDVLNYYGCGANVQKAFTYLNEYAQYPAYWPYLTEVFGSCSSFSSPDDFAVLNSWLTNAFAGVVQSNFAGFTDLGVPLPSFAANVTCQAFQSLTTSSTPLAFVQALAASVQVYYNTSGSSQCFDILGLSQSTPNSWDYQTCTEMWCPVGTNNVTDVFPAAEWDPIAQVEYCESEYGVTPRPDWIPINYGMTQLNAHTLKYASNIFFVNGQLDPWYYACVKWTTNPNINVTTMREGAHCSDQRTPTDIDPPDVIATRLNEIALIQQWINGKTRLHPKPTYE